MKGFGASNAHGVNKNVVRYNVLCLMSPKIEFYRIYE